MQRSGATILSQILNQNPDIWVTPASPLFRMMVTQTQSHNELENVDYNTSAEIDNVIATIPHAFYQDKPAKYIIDKNLNWPSPLGVEIIAKYITKNIKFICPVRNIIDVLTSFDTIINASEDSKDNVIDKKVLIETFDNMPLADRRADYLMRHDKDVQLTLNYLRHATIPEYRHLFHFVDYDDLINNPKKEINKIYDFLEIKKYNHEFRNIKDISGISKDSITGIKNLHTIRTNLQKVSKRPEDVLLPQTIARYSGLEFWRNI